MTAARYCNKAMFWFCFLCNVSTIKFFSHLGTRNVNLILLRRNLGPQFEGNRFVDTLKYTKGMRNFWRQKKFRLQNYMLNLLFSFIQWIKSIMAYLLLTSNKAIFRLQSAQSLITIVVE